MVYLKTKAHYKKVIMNEQAPEFRFKKGSKIGDHGEYEIWNEEPISYGVKNTFAEVYLAVKTKTRKRYAVKILKPSIIMEYERAVLDFQDEIKFLMELEHKNIIKIEDYGMVKDLNGIKSFFLATEYIENADIIKKTYSYRLNLRYAIQTCDGLQYLHRKGIVHRDIKPDNLLLYAGNSIKIADFGIAKFLTQADEVSSVVGPPAYAAPEQLFQTGPVDRRADIYSLGKTIYSIITKEIPKPGMCIDSLPEKYHRKPWANDLVSVLKKATDTDPEKRYQNIDELRNDLVLLFKKIRRKVYLPGFSSGEHSGRKRRFLLSALLLIVLAALAVMYYPEIKVKLLNMINTQPAVQTESDIARQYYDDGLAFYKNGPDDYDKAITLFEKSLEYDPAFSESSRYLAIIYSHKKDYKKSEYYWKQCLKYNTKDESVYINLAHLFISQKRIDEAINVLELLLERNPDSKEGLELLQVIKQ